jgi:hypothetical protein
MRDAETIANQMRDRFGARPSSGLALTPKPR